ncbi:MAG: hypothetical protein D6739_04970, partial [Nitrospirae bacterium]
MLDVLAIEVDGVDVAAGIREDEVFRVVADLARAGAALAAGQRAALVTFGRDPVELALSRHGDGMLLSLIALGPPARLLLHRAEIPAPTFFDAVQGCARHLLADLAEVAPGQAQGPYAARLRQAIAALGASRRQRRGVHEVSPVPKAT